ncbi:hypothetical protein P170DRAFT_175781 [Aspergillus steynii IBT 23096]|uniref:Uncharacterized protein n=1 Tax=Aspergillus steynii IBT 23096 TaxID=1392250 RepID=A0A2I2G8F5_9EURO|nr:uncharacterized protein P170DRAFT_175781 [Aspergillus steynii IBT 23096]PLB49155.1 hypothetical protein P170DRAFT_175781 [Aspergillus steynii IBT 23096]
MTSRAGIDPGTSMCSRIYYCKPRSNNTGIPHACSLQMRWCVAWWISSREEAREMPPAKEGSRSTNDAGRNTGKVLKPIRSKRLGAVLSKLYFV